MKFYLQQTKSFPNHWRLRRFLTHLDIIELLRNRYPEESFTSDKQLLIFDTSHQHTWLIASDEHVFCVIDNRKQERPKIIWRIKIDQMRSDMAIEIDDFDRSYGIIKIGDEKIRKFSKNLYEPSSLRDDLEKLLDADKVASLRQG